MMRIFGIGLTFVLGRGLSRRRSRGIFFSGVGAFCILCISNVRENACMMC